MHSTPRALYIAGFFLTALLPIAAAVPGEPESAPMSVPLPQVCDGKLHDLSLSPAVPTDVEGGLSQPNHNVVQRAADIFSWEEFLALDWPARARQRGEPVSEALIGAPGVRVWETFKENNEVYLPNGAEPPDWNAPPPAPNRSAPVPIYHLLTSILQATQADGTLAPTLTDRNGHLVYYEVRMNRVLFDFIRENGLYTTRSQVARDAVRFPDGSLLIKASWRELEPGEEGRFLTTQAWVSDSSPGKRPHWRRRTMGLTGFHIVQKTPSAPQWIWSTFEQVDNLSGPNPSFRPPSGPEERANQQTKSGVPTLITRIVPIPAVNPDCAQPMAANDNLQALNQAVQQALAAQRSPLQYYALVGTQWPLPQGTQAATASTVFQVRPPMLANTTMETFTQETSTCMGCHAMARTQRTDRFVSSDFTFTLNNARPALTDPTVIGPPHKPVTAWDRQNWKRIIEGRRLAEQTYEDLPQYATAKLHCVSCHLDSGGNRPSAWWVGMIAKYNYPATNKLQSRINQCFQRSMNGRPIPVGTTATSSDAPIMYALIGYMQWLDEQYALHNSQPPQTGLPPIPTLTGNPTRGQQIYVQKCAVCHGKEGKGRYEHDVYYRPALWGPHSFNNLAGLARMDKLPSFLKNNMPFGSGGLLTDQEAWDVATFVDSHPRPIASNR